MLIEDLIARARLPDTLLAAVAALIGFGTFVGLALPQYVVSQKGRIFQPSEITIQRGETIQLINDDADLLHHAYIDSDKISFDSGDQKPGSKTSITFPMAGTFIVLCGIHPKMKLAVHVK
jgi:plastocyanin